MSAVSTYQEAYRIHIIANQAASDLVQEVYNISNAASQDLRSFMGWQFNIQIEPGGRRYDPKAKVDLGKWPSADELKAVLSAWNDADTKLRSAWDDIPETDRIGLTPPPSSMQLAARRY